MGFKQQTQEMWGDLMICNLLGEVGEGRESPIRIAGEGSREPSCPQRATGTVCSLKANSRVWVHAAVKQFIYTYTHTHIILYT